MWEKLRFRRWKSGRVSVFGSLRSSLERELAMWSVPVKCLILCFKEVGEEEKGWYEEGKKWDCGDGMGEWLGRKSGRFWDLIGEDDEDRRERRSVFHIFSLSENVFSLPHLNSQKVPDNQPITMY